MRLTCDDLGLSKDNLLRDATLSLVQLLTNAGNDTQTALQSVGRLLTNQLSAWKHWTNQNQDGNYGHCTYVHHLTLVARTHTDDGHRNDWITPRVPHHSPQRRGASQSGPGSPSSRRSLWSSQGCRWDCWQKVLQQQHQMHIFCMLLIPNVTGGTRWCLTRTDLNLFLFFARPAYLISPVKAPLAVL